MDEINLAQNGIKLRDHMRMVTEFEVLRKFIKFLYGLKIFQLPDKDCSMELTVIIIYLTLSFELLNDSNIL